MIVHLLLANPGTGKTPAEVEEVLRAMESLRQVPGVENFSCGPDFSGRSKGYTLAAAMYFTGRQELSAYATDPKHLEVVATLTRLQVERLVIDYETETSGIST